MKRTAAAFGSAVATSHGSKRRPPEDVLNARPAAHSHREFRAPSTRQDTVLAWCGMPPCPKSRARRWLGRARETALSHQHGANGTTSNGRHELLSPLTADRASEQRPRNRQSCYPHGRFMGEKSGFAKAEALENE